MASLLRDADCPGPKCSGGRPGGRLHRLRGTVTVLILVFHATVASAEMKPAPDSTAGEGEVSAVFYLTNRKHADEQPAREQFSGERGDPHFGRCEVAFTPIALVNHIAPRLPFYLKSENSQITEITQLHPKQFWLQLGDAARQTSTGRVVLFVHGYNYSFNRSCRMAAQLQRSLQDEAVVMMFSWPSNGEVADYVRDQADVEWSVPALSGLLRQLGERIGSQAVQVVAHSLGTRGVLLALQRHAIEYSTVPAIGNLVLLAPDFDSATFKDMLPLLAPLATSITLYASDNDIPLRFSHQLNGHPRLGEAGEYLTLTTGVETIDVSSLGRYQITGHEYFYFNPVVASDLVLLLETGAPASQRPGLEPATRDGMKYWKFTESGEQTLRQPAGQP